MIHAVTRMMNEISSRVDGCLYGAWLYGSAVLKDFQLGWSDIDFVALVDGPIYEHEAESLLKLRQDMLKSEPENPYYRSFEGVITSLDEYCSQTVNPEHLFPVSLSCNINEPDKPNDVVNAKDIFVTSVLHGIGKYHGYSDKPLKKKGGSVYSVF
ncbi:MAG: hypothetical protein K6E85_02555 [Lachnospiraceae bacterium]|nr:hypothetical protein [Lachnospiraceae bacterium]